MNKIAVFGLGFSGKWFINEIGIENVGFIIDNNESMWGKLWEGIEINSLEKFLEKNLDLKIVISTTKYEKEIISQLKSVGYLNYCLYSDVWLENKIKKITEKENKRIFLMNTHSYNNVGDYVITQAEIFFLEEYFPLIEVLMIPSLICRDGISFLEKYVGKEDIILISGGGYLGNLWMDCGETNVRMIIDKFKENKIIILPQTLFFTDDEEGIIEKGNSDNFYKEHSNLIICLRDQSSIELAKEIWGNNVRYKYIPDMALFMNKSFEIHNREGIVLCIRTDKESIVSSVFMKKIEENIKKNDIVIREMSMETGNTVKTELYENAVNEKLDIIKTSKLVITDRLHCMLLCAISGTPCIAFNNLSGKVKGVYSWIKHLQYIKLIEEESSLEKGIKELLNINSQNYYENTEILKKFEMLSKMISE